MKAGERVRLNRDALGALEEPGASRFSAEIFGRTDEGILRRHPQAKFQRLGWWLVEVESRTVPPRQEALRPGQRGHDREDLVNALQVLIREDAATVERIAVPLSRGEVILGELVSVGPWTPAVAEPTYPFAILTRNGVPLDLLRDAFEAARWFVRYEAGEYGNVNEATPDNGWPVYQPNDRLLVARARYDNWFYEYRHNRICGGTEEEPPYPETRDYP